MASTSTFSNYIRGTRRSKTKSVKRKTKLRSARQEQRA